MNFLKKMFLSISSSILLATPAFVVLSCNERNFAASTGSNNLYTNIWNLSQANQIKNSIFDMTIEELENQINDELKKNDSNNFLMKIYSFYLLWQSIKNPLTSSGSGQTNLSSEILSYSTFLSNKLVADNPSATTANKKYTAFKAYIQTFDYRVSILNFVGDTLNPKQTLREVFNNSYYVLNFKFDFWTTDEETNSKMISSKTNKSIMFKNTLTRDQRETLNKINNAEIKEITTNQYNYQSTKLFYNVDKKTFSTIVLPSNVHSNSVEETPDSGYSSSDKSRKLFLFDFYAKNESSKDFSSSINLLLNSSNNFSTSLTSDWTNFLEKEKYYVAPSGSSTKQMKKIEINLNKNFYYDKEKE